MENLCCTFYSDALGEANTSITHFTVGEFQMQKQKVAVIGGGVGAITAVYALTQTKDWQNKYDITVYQLGWRCGGKGASGRNADHGQRIEEHGLHVWAGFYDNAFRNMRSCYGQLNTLNLRDPDAPLGTMDKAFKPLSHLFLAENVPDGTENPWRPWVLDLPTNDTPVGTETKVPGPFEMFLRILQIMIEFLEKGEFNEPGGHHLQIAVPDGLINAHRSILDHANTMPSDPKNHSAKDTNILARMIDDAHALVHAFETPEILKNDPMRRGLYLLDVGLAFAHGVVTSDTFTSGYDVLDQWEFSQWLRMNGASDASVEWVAVRGCYDFVFGFPGGNTAAAGNVGAGTAIRAMSRLIFTYSTAIFHKMQAGMGDTIFAPYFQVLQAMGVKFEYFQAARSLKLNPSQTAIEEIQMIRQATMKDGGLYKPLVDVNDLPCWPSAPLWDQLVDGAKLKKQGVDFESEKSPPTGTPFSLKQGVDFDIVVLGASIGSLPYMTAELEKASPRWAAMLANVKTVGTHAAQFWLSETTENLGWRDQVETHNSPTAIPDNPMRTVITGFAEPLDTWADMTHLLGREKWPKNGPKSIAYFCAPARDGETLPQFQRNVSDWMADDLPLIWPKAKAADGGFDNAVLYPKNNKGLADQYTRVNMYGSERYVLSETNSVFHRLAPGASGFSNLYLAGDWTRCGLNAGCVEAATISGIACASAISGEQLLNVGADDLEPDNSTTEKAMFQTNSVTGAAWPLTPFYARGEMTGWFMFYERPREEVAAMLPDGVSLGICPSAAPGMHPVGMSFCRYHNVRGSFIPDFLSMSPYGEATFAIPYTCTDEGGRAPFLYPRRLYVDNKAAIWAGKTFYAMNKENAVINVSDSRFTATNDAGLNIDARFEQHQDPVALSGHGAHGAISDLLDMSFVTRRNSGKLLYNAFDLQLDRAYVAPATGQISVTDPSVGGFQTTDISIPPLQPVVPKGMPGAFRIWCSWSMTNPIDSKRVRHAAKSRHWLRHRS
ncbi:MAG: hypothetical protein ACI82I_001389 [Gammaproteobacteria bacterium]|jgi:uncharacterized protein with NAD-binding domain and iron-sulfur cluster